MFTNNPTLEVAYSRDHRGLPFFEAYRKLSLKKCSERIALKAVG